MINALPESLLWALGIAGTILALVPILAGLLGLGRVCFVADADAAAAEPAADDAEAREVFDELGVLGFAPVGLVTEHLWLTVGEWHKSFRVHCLSTADGRCFASLYRVVADEGVRVALTTCTSGDGLVQTAMPGAGAQVMNEHGLRVEMSRRPLAELLAGHREHAELFCRQRGVETVSETLVEMTAASQKFQTRSAATAGSAATLLMLLFFALPSAFTAAAVLGLGFPVDASTAVALALCVGSAAYLFVRFWVLPEGMREECLRTNPPRTANPFTPAAP